MLDKLAAEITSSLAIGVPLNLNSAFAGFVISVIVIELSGFSSGSE